MYYEKDGDEVFQHRLQPDVVTLPDYEILQVRILQKRIYKMIYMRHIYAIYASSYIEIIEKK